MTFDQRQRLLQALQGLEDGLVNLSDTVKVIDRIFPVEIPTNIVELRTDTRGQEYIQVAGLVFKRVK